MVMNVGQDVGSYRLVAEISHGEYAIIYQAVHRILTNRSVALKLLYTATLHAQDAQEDFFREARILAELQHPHILPLIDVNLYEGLPYIITEFATQGSLRGKLNHRPAGPVPINEVLSVLTQIGEALDFAHQHNVVHSDVKPENILFNARNEAVLADFDNACVLSRATSATRSLGGTSAYMAPEQFQGKVRKESDQYALACIAYELLTGKRPFHGEDAATWMHAHLYENPLAPTQVYAALPAQTDEVLLKALAKKYSDRYGDVPSFLAALQAALTSSKAHPWSPLVLKNAVVASKQNDAIYSEKTELNPLVDEKVAVPRKRRTAVIPAKAEVVHKKKSDPLEEKPPVKKAVSAKTKRATAATVEADVSEPVKKAASKKRAPSAATKTPVEEKPAKIPARKASVAKKSDDTPVKSPVARKRTSQSVKSEAPVGERKTKPSSSTRKTGR